ncbi:MAG: hypothetical protein RL557_738 [archaeon]|jgi:biofilm PGA synthesis N-glycosyltransferase PgaC
MISIVINSFNESATIGKSIESIIHQHIKYDYELIISTPDDETVKIVQAYQKKNKRIKIFRDPGKGKSYAINLLLPRLKGNILIFTDGDVYLSDNAINQVVEVFNDLQIGCVTGRPVPQENKNSQYGFWAHFLFDAAHKMRKQLSENGKFFECSGYLEAFRNGVITRFPLHAGEDTVIPHMFWERGYRIGYAEEALVFVKNVNNWSDWIKQKTRTTKSHETLKRYVDLRKSPRTKTFFNEAKGLRYFFSYPRSLQEYYWMHKLVLARLYLWMQVLYETRIVNKQYTDNWERVNSTK